MNDFVPNFLSMEEINYGSAETYRAGIKTQLLFFAAYVICKKNYSVTGVVFLFLFSPKLPSHLIQK